jgi:magnesium-transporting ATPase (P-type)
VNDEYIYKYPQVYAAGQNGAYFSFKVFWKWIVLSMWHGAVCFFGTIWVSFAAI